MAKQLTISLAGMWKRKELAARENMPLHELGNLEREAIEAGYVIDVEQESAPIVDRPIQSQEKRFSEVAVADYLDAHPSHTYSRNSMLLALGYPRGVRGFSQALTWYMKARGATLQWEANSKGNADTSDTTFVFTEKLK